MAAIAALSVLAPLAFWTAVAIASAMRPGYDQLASTISRLSVGPNAPVMNAGFIAYGVLTVAIAVALRPRTPIPLGRAALILLALSGAATAGLGIQWIVWDITVGPPASAPPSLTTDPLYDVIHDLLAACAFGFSGLGSLLVGIGVRGRTEWTGYTPVFVGCALVVLVLSAYLAARVPGFQGGAQRIAVVALQAWVAVLAIRLHLVRGALLPSRPARALG